MNKKSLLEDLQEIEFVLFSLTAQDELQPGELVQAHNASQKLIKQLTDDARGKKQQADQLNNLHSKFYNCLSCEYVSAANMQKYWISHEQGHPCKAPECKYKSQYNEIAGQINIDDL